MVLHFYTDLGPFPKLIYKSIKKAFVWILKNEFWFLLRKFCHFWKLAKKFNQRFKICLNASPSNNFCVFRASTANGESLVDHGGQVSAEPGQPGRVRRQGAVHGGGQPVHTQEQGAHGRIPRHTLGNFIKIRFCANSDRFVSERNWEARVRGDSTKGWPGTWPGHSAPHLLLTPQGAAGALQRTGLFFFLQFMGVLKNIFFSRRSKSW